MQKVTFKFLIISFIALMTLPLHLRAESPESELFRADSLYENKQFTEAIKIYNNIFEAGYSSPNMLLKMARIMEGQEKWGNTIYFLEKYYQLTADEVVIGHIQKIVEEHNLNGFQYDFLFYANYYFSKYRFVLLTALLVLLTIALASKILKRKSSYSKAGFAITNLSLLFLCGFLTNFSGFQYGIATNPPIYMMKGPSAGSDVYKKMESATKVRLSREVDVWTKTSFEEKDVYIKTDDIKKL